jgi:hypothetical protein
MFIQQGVLCKLRRRDFGAGSRLRQQLGPPRVEKGPLSLASTEVAILISDFNIAYLPICFSMVLVGFITTI